MAYRDEVDTPLISVIGAFGAVVVFAIMIALQVIYNEAHSDLRTRLDDVQPAELSDLVAQQQAALVEYGYNQNSDKYTIPIRQAMQETVEELSQP